MKKSLKRKSIYICLAVTCERNSKRRVGKGSHMDLELFGIKESRKTKSKTEQITNKKKVETESKRDKRAKRKLKMKKK